MKKQGEDPVMGNEVLVMRNIDKSFPGVRALKKVNLSIEAGEVHALIGENGAGKSTLMKILSGVYQKDAGEILIDGKPVVIDAPEKAAHLGISIIYQELNLMPNLSVAENIFVGREKRKGPFLDKALTLREAEKYTAEVGLRVNVETPVRDLSIAQRQMVEVAKALSVNAKVIIMDEPTSSLTEPEVVILMEIIRKLRNQGTSIVFISHRLGEIFEISDRVTVLRDGEVIGTVMTGSCDEDELIHMMVGRSLTDLFPKETVSIGDVILEAKHISSGTMVQDVSFILRKGEILGFAGLVGAGRSELMAAIFGFRCLDSGKVKVDGKEVPPNSPIESIRRGIGFVPEDRKLQGLVLGMSIRENATLANLEQVSRGGLIKNSEERNIADYYVKKLAIKTPGIEQKVQNLSGGNQQKVVISKWLATNPKVLIMDELTRGIDVGAKKEIYSLITALARDGVGIILISSELPEVLGMSDRIIVMHEGVVKGELSRAEATQKLIMSMILREDEKKAG
jgi:ABC-type sugar transport system ATPase subunit